MFFDSLDQVPAIAACTGTAIFALPEAELARLPELFAESPDPGLKTAAFVTPDQKSTITIDQVREVIAATATKATTDRYFVFTPADQLQEPAANALLKLLEEPKPGYHFLLVTPHPEALLQTILSRAALYVLRPAAGHLAAKPAVDQQTLDLAKRLLVAGNSDLIALADQLKKSKTERASALLVLATAIELAYKSYFATGQPKFLTKIPALATAHQNISQNGNVRLHLVADLLT